MRNTRKVIRDWWIGLHTCRFSTCMWRATYGWKYGTEKWEFSCSVPHHHDSLLNAHMKNYD